MVQRRTFLALPFIAVLQGCITPGGSRPAGGLPATLTQRDLGYTPQFFLGDERCSKFVEIGFSLHCGQTRAWLRRHGKALAAEIRAGRTLALFSHIVRTANEIPVGVELMSAGQERYAETALAALGLSMQMDRALSAGEARTLLLELGLEPDPSPQAEAHARFALGAVRQVYQHGLGVEQTPYIAESGIG